MQNLSVFAYWDSFPDGGHTRRGTLLCSGDSDVIIGNVVLKNPGSAAPFDGSQDSLFQRVDGRLQFAPDATMYAIADLFKMNRRPGVVRLFNLMDYRDTDPNKALMSLNVSEDKVVEEIVSGPSVPTYIGWGDLWKQPRLFQRAKEIFNAALPFSSYLLPVMESNEFIHPLFLMRYGLKQDKCQLLIKSFRACLTF